MRTRCAWCGREFEAKTRRAQFCSPGCRQEHFRARKSGARLPETAVEVHRTHPLDDGDIAMAVLTVRGGIATLDAASVNGPADMRFLCSELAARLAAVLEEVGL